MPTLLRIPEIASGATHAILHAWLKKPGDSVAAGECLAEIETDKTMMELVAEHEGTLGRLYVAAGSEVELGGTIGELLHPGEKSIAATPEKKVLAKNLSAHSEPTASTAMLPGARRFASPSARRVARELQMDLSAVKGSGPNGRILRKDVESAAAPKASTQAPAAPPQREEAVADGAAFHDVPHRSMRKIIAQRLTESKTSIPHFYLTARCNVDRLLELKSEINAAGKRKISVNDFIIRAVALAMQEVPQANAAWRSEAMRYYATVNIAVAVAVDDGLITPVIRGAEKKTVATISDEMTGFAARAREGRLLPQEYQGGSITVSNLGMFGVDEFTAIINPPQAAILAVGAAKPGVVIDGTEMKVAQLMNCTLSVDHRAIDGALAARWLSCFKRFVENPLLLLV